MIPQNPAAIANTWLTNLKNSSQKYRLAVGAITTSPMEQAAAKEAQWAAAVAEAARAGRFSGGLRRVTLAQWKQAASTVGADRIATLPDMKAAKTVAFWQRFLPFLTQVTQRVNQMPRDTYEQRRAKALAMMDGLHEFRNQNAQGGGVFGGLQNLAGG